MTTELTRSGPQRAQDPAALERFFSKALSLLVIADHEHRFRRLNPAWETLLGYPLDELLGRPYLDFVHPDDLETTIAEADAIRDRGKEVEEFENRYRRRDGSYRWLRWNSIVGGPEGLIYAVATDVTGLKHAEERLATARQQLERSEELATLGSLTWRPDLDELRWSPGLHAVTGVDPDRFEPTLEFSMSLLHPDDRAVTERNVRRMATGDGRQRGRYRIVRPDGEIRVLESMSDVELDGEGGVRLVFVTCQDVTEHHRARHRERRAQELERAAFREAPLGIDMVSLDPDSFGRIVSVNRAFTRIVKRSEEELLGSDLLALTHPADRDDSRVVLEALQRGDHDAYSIEKRYVLPDGEAVWVLVHASLFSLDGDEQTVALGQIENITARKRVELLLEMQLRVARVVAGARRLADAAGELLAAVGESLGWRAGAALTVTQDGSLALAEDTWAADDEDGASFAERIGAGPLPATEGSLGEALRKGRCICHDVETDATLALLSEGTAIRSAVVVPLLVDGRAHTLLVFADTDSIRLDETGFEAFDGIAAEVRSLIARERAEAQLAHQALHDPLTGLANRTLLLDRVEQALRRRERSGAGMGLLFLDVDDFKRVNDTLGHPAGDDVLRALGARLDGAVRPHDTVARFGGDEFVVLAEGVDDAERLEELAERVMRSLDAPFGLEEEIHLRASVGATCASVSEHVDTRELVRRADAAMYKAKQRGRGRWELGERLSPGRPGGRLEIERRLRRALGTDALRLVYQPIVSLGDHRVRQVEALLRWTDEELGEVAPATFIPVAEGSGLILEVGELVINEACRRMTEWLDSRALPDLCRISVNLSARQLGQPELPDIVASALSGCGLSGESLALEITETALVNTELAAEALGRLRELGASVVVDDFGTGYASLSSLRHFPLDVLKIDGSFVGEMVQKTGECKIVEAMIELGRALELDVVAEGIEHADQLDLLRRLGCELGQGFLLARPTTPAALPGVISSLRSGAD